MRLHFALAAALAAAAAGCSGGRLWFLDCRAMEPIEERFRAGEYARVVQSLEGDGIPKVRAGCRARAYHLLGLSYERLGKASKALHTYGVAEGLYPEDINILTDLANLLHRSGLDERARPYYERVLDVHPNNAASNQGMAEIHRAQGFLDRAQFHYEKAMRDWGDHPRIWHDYAHVMAEQGKLPKAVRAIRRALKLKRVPESMMSLARFERRQGLKTEAYLHLQEAMLMHGPDESVRTQETRRTRILLTRAVWLLEDSRLDEAEALCSSLIERDDGLALARWVRASVSLRKGLLDEARGDLKAAAAASKKGFIAEVARSMLERTSEQR